MQTRNHASRFEGILKAKLQGSEAQSLKTLQYQNAPQEKLRLLLNRLADLHGRLAK
jgi:hypothetical protein